MSREDTSHSEYLMQIYTKLGTEARGTSVKSTPWSFFEKEAEQYGKLIKDFLISCVINDDRLIASKLDKYLIKDVFKYLEMYKAFQQLVNTDLKTLSDYLVQKEKNDLVDELEINIFNAMIYSYGYVDKGQYEVYTRVYTHQESGNEFIQELRVFFQNTLKDKNVDDEEIEGYIKNYKNLQKNNNDNKPIKMTFGDKIYEIIDGKKISEINIHKDKFFDDLKNFIKILNHDLSKQIIANLEIIEENIKNMPLREEDNKLGINKEYIQNHLTKPEDFKNYFKKQLPGLKFSELQKEELLEIFLEQFDNTIRLLDIGGEMPPSLIDYRTIRNARNLSKPIFIFNNQEKFKIKDNSPYIYFIDNFLKKLYDILDNNIDHLTTFIENCKNESEQFKEVIQSTADYEVRKSFINLNCIIISILTGLIETYDGLIVKDSNNEQFRKEKRVFEVQRKNLYENVQKLRITKKHIPESKFKKIFNVFKSSKGKSGDDLTICTNPTYGPFFIKRRNSDPGSLVRKEPIVVKTPSDPTSTSTKKSGDEKVTKTPSI